MAITAPVKASPTVLARISTLESVGMSLFEAREHMKKLLADADCQASSNDMYTAQLGRELVDEYDTCIEYLDECLAIRKKEEISKMNAMQYAAFTTVTTIGDLREMLNILESKWDQEDIEFLGKLNDQPLAYKYEGTIAAKASMTFAAEWGLVAFDPEEI